MMGPLKDHVKEIPSQVLYAVVIDKSIKGSIKNNNKI